MNTHIKSTCFLFFFIVQFAYSQEYVPFPKDSAVWRESWSRGDSGYTVESGYNQYFLFGDTIINDNQYSIIYEDDTYHPFSPNIPFDSVAVHQLVGLLREENKRIFLVEFKPNANEFDFENEQILYDFNLEVGDTLHCPTGYFTYYPEYRIINSIDSIQTLDGVYRKRYSHASLHSIIEGIGSTDGLFFPCGAQSFLDFENMLYCMGTVDEYQYSLNETNISPDATCYNLFIGTEAAIYQPLTLHPNPTTGIVYLSEPMYDVHISVYSSIGQKVHEQRAFNGSAIDLNGFASGVYFVVMLGDENYLGKVVKE